jgi:hypothetical protein
MTEIGVVPVERVELEIAPWEWPFVAQRRAQIDAYFADQRRRNPTLWNGQLLLLKGHSVADGVLRGTLFETDYASLLAGLEWGAIGPGVKACFAVAALVSADDACLVGIMAPYTRNAGQMLFPSGSLDPADVIDGKLDLDASVQRELGEETGLGSQEVRPDSPWYAVGAGPRLPVARIMRAREPAEMLRQRILSNLAAQRAPEFTDFQIIRGPCTAHPAMPPWMQALCAHIWRGTA